VRPRSSTPTTAARGPHHAGRYDRKRLPRKQFCALGPAAEAFITGAAAAGHTRLGPELAELNTMAAAHGEAVFIAALERATAFGRWRAADVRSILAAGAGTPQPRHAGDALVIDLPVTPGRSLSEYTPGPPSETPTIATVSRRAGVSS